MDPNGSGTHFACTSATSLSLRYRTAGQAGKGSWMIEVMTMMPLAAAGWAFLVWLFGGGLGLALIVFLVMKMMGQ